jgi:plasmid stabilization system protein ParE
MNKIHYSEEAKKDLYDIVNYINQFNSKAAKDTFQKIKNTILTLQQFKEIGVEKPEITDAPLRFLFYDKYIIGYNPNKNPIEIVRILSSEMDLFNEDMF